MPRRPAPNWPICAARSPASGSSASRRWPRAAKRHSGRNLRVRRARQAGRGVVEPAPSVHSKSTVFAARSTHVPARQDLRPVHARDARRRAAAGADMVGFVFFPPSPRHLVAGDGRANLAALAKGRATKVALTVDADDATFENIIDTLRPDILQLHGKETTARVRDIKQKFGLPVMKALAGRDRSRSCRLARLCRGCRPHPVRCPRAEGRHPSGRAGRDVRLACA